MTWSWIFFLNSILLGVGLAMDAFSVSLTSGLNEPKMSGRRMCLTAGTFGIFQAVMPLLGWVCVHTIITCFSVFEKLVPWVALLLLLFIGIKMIVDAVRGGDDEEEKPPTSFAQLMVLGVATSIDALSVGFTIADYRPLMALTAATIIAVVTFVICIAGILIGKKFGTLLKNKAQILGGLILIGIGIEIFITH